MEVLEDRAEALVRAVCPQVAYVKASFLQDRVMRVLVYAPDIKGVQQKAQAVLDQAMPEYVARIEVLVARGNPPAKVL